MRIRRLLCAVALGLCSFAAQATVYTFTGKPFDPVVYGDPSAHVTAWFDIEFSQPWNPVDNVFDIQAWSVDAGPVHIDSTDARSTLYYIFSFDEDRHITEWVFNAIFYSIETHVDEPTGDVYYTGSFRSIGSNMAGDAITVYDYDDGGNLVRAELSATDHPGTWSPRAEVPEPGGIALLGLGGAALAGTRRRRAAAFR